MSRPLIRKLEGGKMSLERLKGVRGCALVPVIVLFYTSEEF